MIMGAGRDSALNPTKATDPMFRLLKYAPAAIALVSKFVKSPSGQRAIAKVRAQVAARRGRGTTPAN
ncbi:hypothetical protein [Conyzicola lurida]|nr:hypothetical protein [Conyzicola lurida]